LLLISASAFTQGIKSDTTVLTDRRHSPNRAANMSALVPGLGQAYNKKYWKIPVIYVAGGALVYAISYNNRNYKKYLNAYRLDSDVDPGNNSEFSGIYTPENLITLKDYYRRYRDLAAISLVVLYAANIIDAYVDAHFFYFDVSDDLSMRIDPFFVPSFNAGYYKPVAGLSLTFNLK
jgi:hypothetical protein